MCTSLRFTKYSGLLHMCACWYLFLCVCVCVSVYWCLLVSCGHPMFSARTTVCPYINMLWKLHQLTPQWQCTFPRCTVGPLPHKINLKINLHRDPGQNSEYSKQLCSVCFLLPPQWWQKVLGRIVHNGTIWRQKTEQHSDDLYLRTEPWMVMYMTPVDTNTQIHTHKMFICKLPVNVTKTEIAEPRNWN